MACQKQGALLTPFVTRSCTRARQLGAAPISQQEGGEKWSEPTPASNPVHGTPAHSSKKLPTTQLEYYVLKAPDC